MSSIEKEQLIQKVETALDVIRPHLAADGGNVEIVEITDDKTLVIKWLGNCQNCNMSDMTMIAGIQQAILGKIPGIQNVRAVN